MWDEEQWAKAQAVKKDPREKAKGLCPEDLEAETLPKGHSAQRRSKHAPLPRKSKGSRRLADSDDEQSEDSDDEVTDDAVQGASRSEPASRHPVKTKAQEHQAKQRNSNKTRVQQTSSEEEDSSEEEGSRGGFSALSLNGGGGLCGAPTGFFGSVRLTG